MFHWLVGCDVIFSLFPPIFSLLFSSIFFFGLAMHVSIMYSGRLTKPTILSIFPPQTLGHLEKAVVLELTLKHVKALSNLIEQQQQQIIALQKGLHAGEYCADVAIVPKDPSPGWGRDFMSSTHLFQLLDSSQHGPLSCPLGFVGTTLLTPVL